MKASLLVFGPVIRLAVDSGALAKRTKRVKSTRILRQRHMLRHALKAADCLSTFDPALGEIHCNKSRSPSCLTQPVEQRPSKHERHQAAKQIANPEVSDRAEEEGASVAFRF
jgi:hypothetical protein